MRDDSMGQVNPRCRTKSGQRELEQRHNQPQTSLQQAIGTSGENYHDFAIEMK